MHGMHCCFNILKLHDLCQGRLTLAEDRLCFQQRILCILCIDKKKVLLSLELKEGITMNAATEVINVRIPAAQKAIIDSAAQLEGKSRTAFILDLAVRHAEDVLAENTHFQLSTEQWDAFTAVLDAPVRSNPALVRLLNTPAPWDK